IYIEVIRSTPFIAQLFLIYYGLSTILFNISGSLGGLNLAVYVNGWTAGIAVLAINYSAYEAEVFRAGFLSHCVSPGYSIDDPALCQRPYLHAQRLCHRQCNRRI